jgi:hypothetical protein
LPLEPDHAGRWLHESTGLADGVIGLRSAAGAPALKTAACDPAGNIQFICGVISPEDLVVVPGSAWVIASGDAAGGAITLINVRDRSERHGDLGRIGARRSPWRVSRPSDDRRQNRRVHLRSG